MAMNKLAGPRMVAEGETDATLALAVEWRGVQVGDAHVQGTMDGRYGRIVTQIAALATDDVRGAQAEPGDRVPGLSEGRSCQRRSSFRSHVSGFLP